MSSIREIIKPFRFLSKQDHLKVIFFGIFSFFLGILDLIGVALVGLLGSLAVSGVQSLSPGTTVTKVLNALNIEGMGIQQQVLIIGAIATFVLISKTTISIFGNRQLLQFLSEKNSFLSSKFFEQYYLDEYAQTSKMNIQDSIHHISPGVASMIMGVVANFISFASDIIVIIILITGLIFVDLSLGMTSIAFFGLIGLGLFKYTNKRASNLGHQEVLSTIDINQTAVLAFAMNKEMSAANRKEYFIDIFRLKKMAQAKIITKKAILPNISKYVLEVGLVVGTMLVSSVQFFLTDAKHAVAFLSIFLVSGARIGPALLRAHQNLLVVSQSLGASKSTLEMIEKFGIFAKTNVSNLPINDARARSVLDVSKKPAAIRVKGVTFFYPENSKPILCDFNLVVESNSLVVFVGKSGSGKTTAIDLIAGIHLPTVGSVEIWGMSPRQVAKERSGDISYLAQDVIIFEGTIEENICVGYPPDYFSKQEIWKAIEDAQLTSFVESQTEGLSFKLVEGGRGMSGGQKQRIGIARSLLSKPRVLILDEPTSALDSQTEADFIGIITEIRKSTTLVMSTHRLEILKLADQICYFDEEGNVTNVIDVEKDLRITKLEQ